MKPFKRRKPSRFPEKLKDPYRFVHHWMYTYVEDDGVVWHAYSLGKRRVSPYPGERVRIKFRNPKLSGMTGWDVDRHRFFVESYNHRYRYNPTGSKFVERKRLKQLGFGG